MTLSTKFSAVYDQFTLDIDASFNLQGVTALFGPSGSGKTTLLKSIAGFVKPDEGFIHFNDDAWFDSKERVNIKPHHRPIGFVFQDPHLFPHLNVLGNLHYPLKYGKHATLNIQIDTVIENFGLQAVLSRKTSNLSGGERQRVAIARALLSQPRLLLLDEPLSGMDVNRKADILPYLKAITDELNVPIVYVSHAIDEIIPLCDDMVVLDQGKVRTFGKTIDITESLDFQGLLSQQEAGSLIEGAVVDLDLTYMLTIVQVGENKLSVPLIEGVAIGDTVRLRIRARDVVIARSQPSEMSIRNVLKCELVELENETSSPFAEVIVCCDDVIIRARITRKAVDDLKLVTGDSVYALIKSVTFDN